MLPGCGKKKGKKRRLECVKINESGRKTEERRQGGRSEERSKERERCVCMQQWKEHWRVRSDKSVTAAASLVY